MRTNRWYKWTVDFFWCFVWSFIFCIVSLMAGIEFLAHAFMLGSILHGILSLICSRIYVRGVI